MTLTIGFYRSFTQLLVETIVKYVSEIMIENIGIQRGMWGGVRVFKNPKKVGWTDLEGRPNLKGGTLNSFPYPGSI